MRALTETGAAFLRTARAQATLEGLEGDTLALVERLRKQGFSAEEAGWLVDQGQLRARARGKLPSPERLLLTDEALQQASGLAVARWRAARFSGRVLDLGAGIGGDTLALAQAECDVVAVERDPVRAALLAHNVAALELADRVEVRTEDWTATSWEADAAFADPARRVGGKRVLGLQEMQPPLDALLALARSVPVLLVKVAPGLDTEEVPPEAGLEFVSVEGELKEALLAFGGLRRSETPIATVLSGSEAHDLTGAAQPPPRVAAPGAFLIEPDPAVIRAGLVRELGQRLDAWQLHGRIAYLSSDAEPATPFARAWRVRQQGKFGRKPLVKWLRDAGAGPVTVKTRGVPIDLPGLTKRLPKVAGGPPLTVFVARTDGGPLMVLAEPL